MALVRLGRPTRVQATAVRPLGEVLFRLTAAVVHREQQVPERAIARRMEVRPTYQPFMAAVLQVRPVRVLVTAGGGNDRANSVALIIDHTLRLCVLLPVVVGVCIGLLAKVSGGFGVGPGIGTVRDDPGDRWAECPVDLLQDHVRQCGGNWGVV